jgi:hypothetical protein
MGDLAIIAPRPAALHFDVGSIATLDLGVAEPGVLVIKAASAEFGFEAPRLATLVFKAEAVQVRRGPMVRREPMANRACRVCRAFKVYRGLMA